MDYITRDTNVGNQPPKFGILCPINTNTFPGKLWKLVNDEDCHSVSWNNSGVGIFINPKLFTKEVLHCEEFSIFKTQNFSSFVRQLNLYGFRKLTVANKTRDGHIVSKDSQMQHFQHPCFLKSRPDMLNQVKRAGGRKRSKDFDYDCESHNIPSSLVKRNKGYSTFSGWESSSKSMSKVSFQAKRRFQLSPTLKFQMESDILQLSPVRDILQPMISPSLFLRDDQHPFRRAEGGLPCDLRLSWMANVVKGSLTSGEVGISPEAVIERGRLKRLVLIPDDLDYFSPELEIPSSQFLGTFRPSTFHPYEMLNTTKPQIELTSSTSVDSVEPQTTLSWSRTSPITTTGYETSRISDFEDISAQSDCASRDREFTSKIDARPSTTKKLKLLKAKEEGDEEIKGERDEDDLIVIKVEPDDLID